MLSLRVLQSLQHLLYRELLAGSRILKRGGSYRAYANVYLDGCTYSCFTFACYVGNGETPAIKRMVWYSMHTSGTTGNHAATHTRVSGTALSLEDMLTTRSCISISEDTRYREKMLGS